MSANETQELSSDNEVKNLLEGSATVDSLYENQQAAVLCTEKRCLGSIMSHRKLKHPQVARDKQDVVKMAKDFYDQYFASIKQSNSDAHKKRWTEVSDSLQKTGTYDHTHEELLFGAKTGWRNAPRCIGRIQWQNLTLFDCRDVTTAEGMFQKICNHIQFASNGGNLRSVITVFRKRTDGKHDFKVWNLQLIRYAGYRQPDGSVIGDPANIEFTQVCESLGWRGKGTMFDVLPIVVSANGEDPQYFDIPRELILEVPLIHPKFPWFKDFGYKWFGLPAVSSMLFDCGGIEFTGSPFSGWYMGTEVGARDFCDSSRYNIAEKVALKMGLDIRKNASLWKDRALVEVNIAVLHSYQTAGVTIMDHHSASDSFMQHFEREQEQRGGCPADWVWIVPPMSGSLCDVFHQEMIMYRLKPSYEYQDEGWRVHEWKDPLMKQRYLEAIQKTKSNDNQTKSLDDLMKCVVLFATETGKSERFAKRLCQILKNSFNPRRVCMDSLEPRDLANERLVFVVASTFGNGDAPENGVAFEKSLNKLATDAKKNGQKNLKNTRYSVFALGSRSYPNFCNFGHHVDELLGDLGAERILQTGEGDELCGQEESFKTWARQAFKAACDAFNITDDVTDIAGALSTSDNTWKPDRFRIREVKNGKETELCPALSKLHKKTVVPCKVLGKTHLQSKTSPRETILVRLSTESAREMTYVPGDHLGIFPANSSELVEGVLARLHDAPPPSQIVQLEVAQDQNPSLGAGKSWTDHEKIPACSLRTALTRYIDVTTPPSQDFLKLLSTLATRNQDKDRLDQLSTDSQAFEQWRNDRMPTLLEVLDEFPSLQVPPSVILTQLPLLQQRYYSISSSPDTYKGEVHATVAVLKYRTQGGAGPIHEGVCSTWLERCEAGDVVPCLIRGAANFRLPEDKTAPVVMIGPGTGIAPFRSFWQQRGWDMNKQAVPKNKDRKGWGEMKLYFGCRTSKQDHIYDSELQDMKNKNVLTDYFVAMSREPGEPKTYVQDIISKHSKEMYSVMAESDGHIYVCGDVKMADDVKQVLTGILSEKGNMSNQEAKTFIVNLRNNNRYHEDIFGVGLGVGQKAVDVRETSRDQGQRAMKFINSTGRYNGLSELVAPIPKADRQTLPFNNKPPTKNIFRRQANGEPSANNVART